MGRVLGVYCVNDEPTLYAAFWCQQILAEARAAGHETSELAGYFATEYGLLTAMEQYQPDIVVLAGHGGADVFTGAGMEIVLRACTNDQMMRGSSSLFISCLTGLQLVPSMVSKGSLVAQGFTKEYIWMIDGSGDPATDPYAASFMRQLVEPARALFASNNWADWYNAFMRVTDEEIAYWGSSGDPLASSVMFCLRNNKSAVTLHGAGLEFVAGDGLLIPVMAVAGVVLFKPGLLAL